MKNLNSKNIITIVLMILAPVSISLGQGKYSVESIQKLPVVGYMVKFSPDGDKLILTSSKSQGLKLYDIGSGKIKDISSEQKAGHKAVFGNSEIVFQSKDGNRINRFNLDNGQTTTIASNLSPKEFVAKSSENNEEFILAKTNETLDQIILVSRNGTEVILAPQGRADYLNVSLSPDRTKVLFRVSGLGSFISDTQGTILKDLGNVEFPTWIDNETVLYASIEDDGHHYIKSDLSIQDINETNKLTITSATDAIALYPSVNKNKNRVAFNSPTGEVYIIKLTTR